ncbi:hypothetical protein QQZ08_007144 [Neonectria magnoliae]|uniref:Mid2 domain-containing protein n=1 Tax=Neonectria magnoliae TaxID=2732573 RepID=A0ABR1HZH4_9HYPO
MDRLASNLRGTNMESLNDKANVVNAEESATSTTKNLALPTSNSGNGPGNTGGSPSGPGEAQDHVSFADLGTSVFALSSVPTQAFKYGTTDDVEIDGLAWQGWDGNANYYKQISRATFDDEEADFDASFIKVSTSGATLNFTRISDDSLSSFISNKMRLVVNWHTSELTGNTTSTIFAIVNTDAEVNDEEAIIDAANKEVSDDEIEVVSTLTASPTADSTSGGGLSDSEPSDSAASATSSAESDSSSGGGGGGGLAKGAIAGIAVGAVIGVLLIGALAWFFLRKRRQNKKLAGGYTGTDSAGTYMVDKETHGRTTDSPNSPYTDDNRHVPIDDSARDIAAIGTTDRGGITRTSTSGSHGGRASTSGTQTPQGMSSNVAHLVEDGMTADEIRRLEEEERQLDDEIERAARR